MIFRFLKTKIGLALVAAIIIIAAAVAIKIKGASPSSNLQQQVKLIADVTVENALKSGAASNLDDILGTSTVDSVIAKLPSDSSSSAPENLTATDRFAREFFQKYIDLKQSGAPIDENTGTDLVNQLLQQDYGGPTEEKTYTESDIKIISATTLQALKQYGNALGAVIQRPLPAGYEQELSILATVTDTGDESGLSKLPINIAHYQSLRDDILAIPVPAPLKTAHIALINSLSAILEGIKGMALIQSDPVGATKMIARYRDGLDSVSLPLEIIKTYLQKQDVSFSSYESGYILTQ